MRRATARPRRRWRSRSTPRRDRRHAGPGCGVGFRPCHRQYHRRDEPDLHGRAQPDGGGRRHGRAAAWRVAAGDDVTHTSLPPNPGRQREPDGDGRRSRRRRQKSISAKFTDTAGNSSTTSALAITLDTTAECGADRLGDDQRRRRHHQQRREGGGRLHGVRLDADATATVTFTYERRRPDGGDRRWQRHGHGRPVVARRRHDHGRRSRPPTRPATRPAAPAIPRQGHHGGCGADRLGHGQRRQLISNAEKAAVSYTVVRPRRRRHGDGDVHDEQRRRDGGERAGDGTTTANLSALGDGTITASIAAHRHGRQHRQRRRRPRPSRHHGGRGARPASVTVNDGTADQQRREDGGLLHGCPASTPTPRRR